MRNLLTILLCVCGVTLSNAEIVKTVAEGSRAAKTAAQQGAKAPAQVAAQTAAAGGKITAARPFYPGAYTRPQAKSANNLSPEQTRLSAQIMRKNFHYKSAWEQTPQNPDPFNDLNLPADIEGNLTKLNEQQFEKAVSEYEQAVAAVRKVAGYMDANIYYLSVSGREALVPAQLYQFLNDIGQAQQQVNKAKVTWGKQESLDEMALYLQKAREFYTMLSTGEYRSLTEDNTAAVARADGHTYNYEEFNLCSEFLRDPLRPTVRQMVLSWLGFGSKPAPYTVPENLRVAVLQDNKAVVENIKKMQEKKNLTGWQIDYYADPDPEQFLKSNLAEKYDLIFMDVLMKNGGGRYLTRQLRAGGYEGTVLALSGFDVHNDVLFNDGFDGIIPLEYAWNSDGASLIWRHVDTYYGLKARHGWVH